MGVQQKFLMQLTSQAISRARSPVLKGLHRAAHHIFTLQGYQWELRRNGEMKLGLWRKTLHKPSSGKAYPRRFVLVPGFGDTPLSWAPVLLLLLPILRTKYDEIILVDFPGYTGFLSEERAFPTMDLLMSTLFDVLDSLKPRSICGHSLGGCMAAHYAALCGSGERPARNNSKYAGPEELLLVCTSGVFENEEARKTWDGKIQGLIDHGFSYWRNLVFAKEPFWFKYVETEFGKFVGQEEILELVRSVRDEHYLRDALAKIRCKVWLIWGEKDGLIPTSALPAWLAGLTSAREPRAVILRGLGHSPQIESTAVTAAVLGQVLSSRTPHLAGRRWWTLLETPLQPEA